MDFSRTEYPGLLTSLQPEQAVNILNDRVDLIKKINIDIADWLQERRRVEEAYVVGLRKLARRPQQDGAAALGIFQMPWQRIVSGTENLAASHETLAMKIETDVETPLRQFASRNREMQTLSTTQGNLNSLAKELVNAQRKAAKGGRKADSASSTVEDASRQWESQAPYVFEQLQALDETRVNHLRDVLTQFQTHEVDAIEKNRLSAESCLNALLNIETADEIKTFATRASSTRNSLPRRRSSAAASASARPPSSHLRPPPTPPPPRHADDRQSQRTNSFAGQDRLAPLSDATPHKEKSKLGGLKRLGTVMGRRKSMVPPVPSQSTEEKRKTRSFVPFRRGDSSRSFQDLEETGQDLTPSTTRDQRPVSSISRDRHDDLPSVPQPEPPLPMTNGAGASPAPLETIQDAAPLQPALLDTVSTPQSQPRSPEKPQPPIPASNPWAQESQEVPITALANDEASRNFMIRDKPIQEDESEAQNALSTMANQLRTQAQSSGINRVQGSVRGRRDVRNTMYVPSGTEPFAASPSMPRTGPPVTIPSGGNPADNIASPIQRPPPAAIIHEDHGLGSDTTSIHSSRSLAGPTHHVDLHEPGLNASIVENVHSWFTEQGITKCLVLGEVAFAYNPPPSGESGQEIIRVQHFELLDKVAANPIFLTQVKPTGDALAEEQAGSYTVATPAIRRPSPMIGLKYQLHIDTANLGRYCPVFITPAWQVIQGQVSVIVLYSLNPVFGNQAITLKNAQITVNLDVSGEGTGRPVSAMMSPTEGAVFRRKTSAVVWRHADLEVKPEQQRLLVRFMTEGGMPKKGTIELKFEIPGRTASGVGVEKVVTGGEEKDNDPFADDTAGSSARGSGEEKRWESLPTKTKLISGRYTAN
ncbi:Suppressor of Profilin deletion [Knufia peltigerae]|uniref:Suppressor of Profilin deletion n=1 Tax=Knufia peltigerae TaxID=1002370 RepID=A0AA38Y0P2_9EURO|nr:Suppressor of Profilin deletion [Knufia peltigerae]